MTAKATALVPAQTGEVPVTALAVGLGLTVTAKVLVVWQPVAAIVSITWTLPLVALLAKLIVIAFPVAALKVALVPE